MLSPRPQRMNEYMSNVTKNFIQIYTQLIEKNKVIVHVILYHKSNLVYTVVFPQFLNFQQNNSAQTSVLIFFTSRHYYFSTK